MRCLTLLTAVVAVAVGHANTLAVDIWCYTNFPDAIFCDDFDRYCCPSWNEWCSTPPPWPEACDPLAYGGDIRDNGPMQDVWNVAHNCGWVPGVHDEYYNSYPYGVKLGCQEPGNEMGYGNHGLGSDVQNKFGSSYVSVLATDLTPLTMEFSMNGRTYNKIHFANVYVELGYGRSGNLPSDETSITNYIFSDDCVACGDTSDGPNVYPIICRQSPTPAGCANPSTAPVLPVIAAGALSYLDQNPCHCGEGAPHSPYTTHLAFFDGRVWHTLYQGLFPDPGGEEPATGDFELVTGDAHHNVRLTIKSTSVIVEMRVGSPVVLSRCEVPLEYQGPFNSILVGFQPPCQLTAGTWDCNGADDCNGPYPRKVCCVGGAPGGGTVALDNFAVYGGQGYAVPGICCMPDLTCIENQLQGDCVVSGGEPGPSGSTCNDTACCPTLAPDHDVDTDIDLADFGWFQACLAGPDAPPPTLACDCADYDNDEHVDEDDLTILLGCMSGPGIPADPNCAD